MRGSCNTINDPFARVCVPDGIDNIDAKVSSNLFILNNETRYYQNHVSCPCKCRVDKFICEHDKKWNKKINVDVEVKIDFHEVHVIKTLFNIPLHVTVSVIGF